MGYRRRGYWRDDPPSQPPLKPWEREYPHQYVCKDCHTAWDCNHASNFTALLICSRCGLAKECVRCKRYQPKRKDGRKGLHNSEMPLKWRRTGRWLCLSCRPEHEFVKRAGARLMVCEKCWGAGEECHFYYPDPVEVWLRRWARLGARTNLLFGMKFDIVTIFPSFFESFKQEALIARAQAKKLISINTHFLRDYADDERGTIDGRPYGGGAGMVLLFDPIYKAVKKIKKSKKTKVIVFNPKGKKFDQAMARKFAKLDQLILICGRYEGIDERVMSEIADEEVSIGDYVLFGGEVPAMVVMEAVTRLIPGAVAKEESTANESFSDGANLEHPHYTRPEVISIGKKKLRVPKVLLSGDHKKIAEWRKKNSRLTS